MILLRTAGSVVVVIIILAGCCLAIPTFILWGWLIFRREMPRTILNLLEILIGCFTFTREMGWHNIWYIPLLPLICLEATSFFVLSETKAVVWNPYRPQQVVYSGWQSSGKKPEGFSWLSEEAYNGKNR